MLLAVSGGTVLAVSSTASSQSVATGTPGVSIIAQRGFGDHHNSFAWSMIWFKGKLYVGTGRDEICVENETTNFYYPNQGYWVVNAEPNVHCPRNPYDMSLQAEIWQYTPPASSTVTTTTVSKTTTTKNGKTTTTESTTVPAGGTWTRVYKSPLLDNPLAKGKKIAESMAFRGMIVIKNPQTGERALFVAGVSPDEFIPPLQKSHPPVLMRSYDGVHWQALKMPAVVDQYPGGNDYLMGYRSMIVWHGHMFVTGTPEFTGDGSLFEVTNEFSDHPGLRQVSGPGYDIFEIQVYNGGLYIGTGNRSSGYGVYRTFTYTKDGYFNFQPVVTDGAGRGRSVTSVVSMQDYKGRLYIGSSGWYNKHTVPASELIRINPDGSWQLVVGSPRNLADGETMYPISGIYDGFFSPFAAHFWRMADWQGGLYLTTNDWAYLVQENKQFGWLQETVLAGVLGFNVWSTCDGTDWYNVTRDAFTGDEYNFGGRTIVNGGSHDQDLFIGSANQAQGTSIFDDTYSMCSSLVGNNVRRAARATPTRPAALMTESPRHGTLLSWERSADATSYTVYQAPFESLTVGLKAPATLPDGWNFEDATPTVTAVGAPGSVTTTLSVPGQFQQVGTSEGTDFVTPRSGHYVYEVVANTRSGRKSAPSNLEITPFGGPPATFKELNAVIGAQASAASTQGRVANARQTTFTRLLQAARTAVASGRYGVARRVLTQIGSLAGGNAQLALVAQRIARRLQYVRIAGKP